MLKLMPMNIYDVAAQQARMEDQAAGMEIPCGILTIDELVAALEPLLKRKEA